MPITPRFIVLVPDPTGEEFHVATRGGRLVTTTERTQIGLGRIEGRRPPVVLADNVGDLPTVDLLELLTDQVQPTAPAAPTDAAATAPAAGAKAG